MFGDLSVLYLLPLLGQRMDIKSQFVNRYKKDLSTEIFRAKIARRKSVTQKENRHKAFRKSRGLPLHDLNISPLKESDISQLEGTKALLSELEETKEKSFKTSVKQVVNQRLNLLQRFKEEKQLRKLKEQREKAKQSVFRCGLYKPDVPCFLPGPYTGQAKQREKQVPSAVARVTTRSMAKNPVEQAVKIFTRSQNSMTIAKTVTKGNGNLTVQSGHIPPTATRKEADKEKVFPTVTHTRTTRATTNAMTKQLPKVVGIQTQRRVISKDKQQKADTGKTENVQKPSHKPSENILISQISERLNDCKNLILSRQLQESVEEKRNSPVKDMTLLVDESRSSFAPPNFIFQPLNGLSSYKVKPMTPHRANAFLTPCYTWSPVKIANNPVEETTSPVKTQAASVFHFPPDKQIADLDNQELTLCGGSLPVPEKDCTTEIKTSIGERSRLPVSEMILKPSIEENKLIMSEELSHNVPYFRGIICSESKRLTSLCVEWEEKIELDIPEDAKALIRTTVGQTRLLMMERFKQFEGLVDDCEFKRGEKETTCTDLDGFWDMVSFQIDDVDKKFDNLIKLQKNNWQHNITQIKKAIKKKVVSMPISKSNQDDTGRAAAARNRLAAVKAAMKCKKQQQEEGTETAASETLKEVEKVVFEAGFFRIESPVKPAPGSSSKMRFSASFQNATPKSILKTLGRSKMVSFDAAEQAAKTENIGALQIPDELLSSARKVLFGNAVEQSATATGDEDCPMVEDAEFVTASNEINTSQESHFVPLEACGSYPILSDNVEAFDVKTSEYPTEGAEFTTDEIMQDVVMVSPQKTTDPPEAIFPLEILGNHETEILSTKLVSSSDVSSCDPLDFLKSTPKVPEIRSSHFIRVVLQLSEWCKP
uniref:Disks large-associated protein 5 isoform X2 n=1 Tax=Geotrypetes seraphini TaxID=260995 RepID=A0A6P8RS04_GEOSA|nr:disks large-associated protein 5 isoform X2 [Geotrypetes seraphini]